MVKIVTRIRSVEGTDYIKCPHCFLDKELSEYSPAKNGSGYQSWCKQCNRDRVNARNAPIKEQNRIKKVNARLEALRKGGKTCSKCIIFKTFDEFSPAQDSLTGTASWCKKCYAKDAAERRDNDPLYSRRMHLWSSYKITLEEYDSLLEMQGGGCGICGKPPGNISLHVDHDHACCPEYKKSCGECVRGLLCYPCNGRLYLLESNVPLAVASRAYLGVEVVRI